MQVFDRGVVRRHRDRAAPKFADHDVLVDEIADRFAERLGDSGRKFPTALDLGCHTGGLGRALQRRFGIEVLVQADLSPAMVGSAAGLRVAADEEALPFAGNRFDLVISAMSMHWVNDLPGALIQINRCLKPDGLFLAAMPGGSTLTELRRSFLHAEAEIEGGSSPRVSPFVDVRDAGALLQRAGFARPVAEIDTLCVTYADARGLMRELRGMGEANALIDRRKSVLRRATLEAAADYYRDTFAAADGRIVATFQMLYLTGWGSAP